MHTWGDKDFDWDSLYESERILIKICKIFRIGLHSKEKYGTLRTSFYLFNGSIHSIIYPGYVRYIRYPGWKIDVYKKPLKFLIPIIIPLQTYAINLAYHIITSRFPHLKKEILSDAPSEILYPDLAMFSKSLWSSFCKKCDKISKTDNYYCPFCNQEKE